MVVTVELRSEVFRIAEMNSWSSGLFTDGRVHKLVGDVYAFVGAFPDGNSALILVAARLRHISGTKWSSKGYLSVDLLKEQMLEHQMLAMWELSSDKIQGLALRVLA